MLWDYLVIDSWKGLSEREVDGFEKLVIDVWHDTSANGPNDMLNLMNKLKNLKKKICVWNGMRQSFRNSKHSLQLELADLELVIDKGNASDDIIYKRLEIVKSIQELDKQQSMEMAQKAKIKWAIEAGIWIKNPNLVKNELLTHLKNRFKRPKKVRPVLIMDFPRQLNSMKQMDMEAEVLNEEIKKAVWDCGTDKSPGPDGFSFGFYRRFWSVIEKDVVAAVKYFFQFGSIPKGCNSSFIALIPKVPDAKMVKDFKPISLIGSLYKIIAKILANRLVMVLGDLVNKVQSAFVADRQILDGPFILNEIFQWCKSKKKHSFIFKIDFEKAYDSVRWDYLDDKLVDAGMFKGIALDSSMILSHMFYADDAVFVGQWSNSNIDTIIYALKCFERASSLSINMSKSKIMVIAVNEEKVEQFAHRIGCGILNVPFTYLGSKVGGVCPEFKLGMRFWTICLLVPLCVLHRMESIRCQFFNRADLDSKKAVWVKWNKVLSSKEKGVLGVSSLYALNRALLFKWVWRFTTQKSSLWARVITAIHGVDGKISHRSKSGHKSICRDIVQDMEVVKNQGAGLFSFMQKKLGNGADTYFWEDTWRGDMSFKQRYPRLYALELDKNINVAAKFAQTSLMEEVALGDMTDKWYWSLEGSGDFSVASVKKLIDDIRLSEVSSQTRWIKAVPIKVESVSHVFFACHVAKDNFQKICRWWNVDFMEHLWSFRNKCVFGSDIPPKERPFDDVVVRSFYWIRSVAETRNHLFFGCSMALGLFQLLGRWWNIQVPTLSDPSSWESCGKTCYLGLSLLTMGLSIKQRVLALSRYGLNPSTPLDLAVLDTTSKFSKEASDLAAEIKTIHHKVHDRITKNNELIKYRRDKGRKHILFKLGDLVWLHMRKERFPTKRRSKLSPRSDGPFMILEKVNDNVYKIDLLGNVSTSCNVADLQPYFDPEEPLPILRTNFSDEMEDDRQALEYPISALDLNPPESSSDISLVDSGQNLQKWVSLVQSDSLKT
ncbi:RNA-directed DNA polymerase, eukaryota, reverse transcriptase zinc-binding domain protein [Tanacetum coccineum]